MPIDEQGGEYMTMDQFMAETDPATRTPDTSSENVARAVRFLESWLPIGARGMGEAAHGDVRVLMAFARERLDEGS